MDIFDLTHNDYSNRKNVHDINDRKMVNLIKNDPESYEVSKFVILGCPQDLGVIRNGGRKGSSIGPNAIRSQFYKMSYPKEIKNISIFDLGDLIISSDLEDIHINQEKVVKKVLSDDKIPIVLGGGNDISYPDLKALYATSKNILAVNVDQHLDIRDMSKRNSGTPYRMLIEENILNNNNFIELAIQQFSNSYIYYNFLEELKFPIFTLDDINAKGLPKIFELIKNKISSQNIFWGIDMDSIKASDAPGVSAPSPTGLTSEQIIAIAKFAGSFTQSKIFEITEMNPSFDIDHRTAKLAGHLILNFINQKNKIENVV